MDINHYVLQFIPKGPQEPQNKVGFRPGTFRFCHSIEKEIISQDKKVTTIYKQLKTLQGSLILYCTCAFEVAILP